MESARTAGLRLPAPLPVPRFRRSASLPLLLALAAGGCAVGPDFRAPAAPPADALVAVPAATVSAPVPTGDAQRFLSDQPVPAQWWRSFGNAELDRRVERALANSPNVDSAEAALRQAAEGIRGARGALLPAVDAGLGATRQNGLAAGQAGISPFTVHHATARIGYTLDLFGGVRRGIEAQSARADLAAARLLGTYLSLAVNVVTTSVREASLRAQIAATEEIVEVYGEQLALVDRQYEIGAKSQADVLLARSERASATAQLPPLRKALAQTRTQLAVYLGELPGEAGPGTIELDALRLPQDLPVALPSTLVRVRPDIRIAEAELHRASAEVGIATANLFPNLTLTGSYGSQAARSGDLFGSGSEAWSLGLNLLQPVFRGGSLRAQKRAAEAGLDQAAADYRQTVLTAFQNVADSLQALELDAESLAAQAAAVEATRASRGLVEVQFREGATSQLQVLDATRQFQQARIALIQARAARLTDTAALYAALGGGWRGDMDVARAASAPESN